VQWNAAFALARKGDAAGRDVLVRLLDRSYVDKFTTIMPQNRQRYRVAAVQALVKLDNTGALEMLKEVSEKDSDLQVRNAAIQELNRLKEPSP
jgi:HEAT repeat protein